MLCLFFLQSTYVTGVQLCVCVSLCQSMCHLFSPPPRSPFPVSLLHFSSASTVQNLDVFLTRQSVEAPLYLVMPFMVFVIHYMRGR